ncbi:MAG: pbpE 2 [Acidimicrobiales bacterium]|nr:pbpE 2 [Acidimicrobiales bacterium]
MNAGTAAHIEALLRPGMDDGSFLGAQVYASVRGHVVADLAVGEARPGMPMTTDTVVSWQCNTKPVTAVAACQLHERGLLDLDAPVADYVPELGRHGKHAITVRQLLTHSAGFAKDPPLSIVGPMTWERVAEVAADGELLDGWEPGTAFRYSTWYGYATVGVVVSRIDGRTLSTYVREEIFESLGMDDCWVGVDPGAVDSVATRMAFLYDTSGPEPRVPPIGGVFQARYLDTCSPGNGGIGPVRQLGRLWESLLESFVGGDGKLLRAETVRAMTRQGVGPYGLGVLVAPGYFGAWCPDAFGHDGMRSSLAFADPATGVVFTAMLNGMGHNVAHRQRLRDIGDVVYEVTRGRSSRN